MGQPFRVTTTLYGTDAQARKDADRVESRLKSHAWTIDGANLDTQGRTVLAGDQPYLLVIERPGATQADAEKEVSDAINDTGSYSLAGKVSVAVGAASDAAAKVSTAVGKLSDKAGDNPDATLGGLAVLSTTLLVVAGLAVAAYLFGPAIRRVA